MIKKRKNIGKITQILSTILAVVILATAVFTSGVLATEILNEDNSENIFDIEVKHNGYLVQLTNKPFFENGVMYLPLRELLEKTGLLSQNNCRIEWDNGKITIYMAEIDNLPEYDSSGNQIGTKQAILNYCYGIEIGKAEYIVNPNSIPLNFSDNPLYTKHFNIVNSMYNAPILKNGITYIPYDYVNSMINMVMQNNVISVDNITNTEKSTEKYANVENMSLSDIRSLQLSVDNGHFPWRLDYEQVVKAFLSGKGENVENGKMLAYSGNNEECSITYSVNDNIYEIELFKPIDKSKNGIWVIMSFKQIPYSLFGNTIFTDNNGKTISKNENGYNVDRHTIAYIPLNAKLPDYDGRVPKSATAYFTPSGTGMETYQQEIGRVNGPFRELPISMELTFEDNIKGQLHFVFEYEDGTKAVSPDYNVFR